MNPVISQPGVNHCFKFPSPPTPPRTDDASFDYGLDCCLRATTCGSLFGAVGAGVGSLLETAVTGTVASVHLPLSLCCAFGFSCFWRNLDNQSLEKKCQLDYAYLQELQTYNVQLRERVVMLLTESRHSTGKAEDRQQQKVANKISDILTAVSSKRESGIEV